MSAGATGLRSERTCVIHQPRSLGDALAIKAEHRDGCTILAGGTDLMVGLRPGEHRWDRVLDLWRVPELRGIRATRDGTVVIGATTTFGAIIRSEVIGRALPMLREAARTIGAEQIQSRATIGGNIANASPAADSVPVLSACDAELVLASVRGERTVSIHDFYRGYKVLDLEPDELVSGVRLPPRLPPAWDDFRKVGTRAAQSIAKVVIAMRIVAPGATIERAAIAIGSVAPTVVRAAGAEKELVGAALKDLPLAGVRRALMGDIVPIDDIRSTAVYRRRVTENVVVRMLGELASARAGFATAVE